MVRDGGFCVEVWVCGVKIRLSDGNDSMVL